MTSKVVIDKRGGGTIDLTGFTGRKGTPFFDGDQELIALGRRFADGEASQGTFRVMDPDAEIPRTDYAYNLPGHKRVWWTEDASGTEIWLAKSRLGPYDGGRGVVLADNEVEYELTATDANIELRYTPFTEEWERPEETDVARLLALRLYILNGASSTAPKFRATTDITIATDHLAPNTSTVTMPAKTYPVGTNPDEVIRDCADTAGKRFGVVIHHVGGSHDCLLYIVETDHTTYPCAIKVSDHIDEWDPDHATAPVVEPHWLMGKASLYDPDELLSGLLSIYGPGADDSVFVEHAANVTDYDYWVDVYNDADAVTSEQAVTRAAAILEYRRLTHVTHRFSIVLSPEQVQLITVGMSIQVKAAAAMGGQYLDIYQTRRIAECTFRPRYDGKYWVDLHLDRSLRRRPYSGGPVQPAATTPQPPTPSTPGTDTTWEQWTWEDAATVGIPASYTDEYTVEPVVNSWNPPNTTDAPYAAVANGIQSGGSLPTPPSGAGGTTYFHSINHDNGQRVAWSPGDSGTIEMFIAPFAGQPRSFTGRYIDDLANTIQNLGVLGSTAGLTEGTWTGFVFAFPEAPAGTTGVEWKGWSGADGTGVAATFWIDEVTIKKTGAPATAGSTPPSLGGPGEGSFGTDSGTYLNSDTVIEHGDLSGKGGIMHDATQVEIADAGDLFTGTTVEAALQELGGGTITLQDIEAQHRFLLCAHRGDINPTDGYPENTLEAVRQAIMRGAHEVELDVQQTSDGVWMLLHDETLTRTTNLTDDINDVTAATVEAGHIDGGYGYDAGRHGTSLVVPRLIDVLDAIRMYDCVVNFDLKDPVAASNTALAEFIIANWYVERSIINTKSLTQAAAIKAVDSRLVVMAQTGVTSSPQTEDDVDIWLAERTEVTSMSDVTSRAPERVDLFFDVTTDYGDDESTWISDAFDYGVRAILTNDLPAAQAALATYLGLGGGVTALDDLSDVTITSAAAGDILRRDGTAFVNVNEQAAGHWEVVVSGSPASEVLTEDSSDWVYGWIS